jgi:F-type H+-transporting ATPase subunit b
MLNTALLLVALYYLLYKPVKKFLKKREDKINGQLDNANLREKQAVELLEARKKQLEGASAEVAELILVGEKRGKARADEIMSLAQGEARRIEIKAKAHAESMESNAQVVLYEKAANLSVDIAQMVLEREVTIDDHKRLLEEFFEKAGRA